MKSQATANGTTALGVLATATGVEATSLGAMSAAKGERSIALGAGSTASGNKAFAAGDGSLASANNSIAIGSNANASAVDTTALGANSTSSGINSTALGKGSTANATDTVAVGQGAQATAENATSMGSGAIASAKNSVAIGQGASASNSTVGSIALGKNANSSATGTLAIGTSSIANATYAHAYGDTTKVYAERAIAVGLASNISAGSTNATLLGSHATIGANSVRAVSVGSGNSVSSANATALGSGITIGAGLESAVVLGANSGTTGSHTIATETGATVNGVTYSGFKGVVSSVGRFVSVGSTGNERKIINLAAGNVSATSTEAINGSQLYMVANELKTQMGSGSSIQYFSVNSSVADNQNNNGATGLNAIAIGPNSTVTGNNGTSIGINSRIGNAANAVAIGREANVSGDSGTAIGNSAHAVKDATAYGVLSNASAERATAIGAATLASAANATAVGNQANATSAFATSIGNKAIANISNGVALGAGSVTTRDIATTGGYDMLTGTASTATDKTWKANAAAVSVGNATHTRQIVNVAAGSEDTDAVNVAQLKKVQEKLDNLPTTLPKNLAEKLGLPTDATGNVTNDLGIPAVAGSDNANTAPTTLTGAVKDVAAAVNKGISLQGNDTNPINKKLGETFAVVGTLDASKTASSKNVRTKTTDGKLEILISENPEFETVSAGTLAVKNADGTTGPKMTSDGIDAASQKITNVAAGTDDKDAVNFSQLKALKDVLGLAIGRDGQLTPEASAIRNADGSLNNNPDLASTVRSQTTAINSGIVYGADTDDYKPLANSQEPNAKKQQLGSTLAVKAATESLSKTGISGKEFVGTNLVTKYVRDEQGNGLISIGMSDKPEFKEVTAKDGDKETKLTPTGTTVKDGNKEATYGVDGIGLKGDDGKTTTLGRDKDGNLTIKKEGEDAVTLATQGISGNGKDGKDGKDASDPTSAAIQGPTGKDGLNGKDLTTKVNALRNGEAGPVVYTDADGNRLVKANNGKYYPAGQVGEDGEPVAGATAVDSPIASVVNPDGSTTAPTTMGNVKSTIGLNGKDATGADLGPIDAEAAKNAVAGADGQSGLLAKKGAELNNVATVGDLQAIAQAGLDFTGNNNTETTLHRTLGSKLVVEGETDKTDVTKATFGATAKDNIHVEAKVDGDTNKLIVSLAEDLKGINKVDFKPTEITNPDGTKTYAKSEISSAGNKYKEVNADGTEKPNGKTAEYGLNGAKIADKDNVTEIKPDGLTAKSADPNDKSEATYGKDGLTVKGNDGKDAIALTSKTDDDGKTTNTLALNGKDAVSITSGKDGESPAISFAKNGEDGTGSITGLKDVERNPDGTAKDKTQAANAGYVDDRLKEMNDGKPFEYFTKDADGNDVKVVRGKDGKFYAPKDLEGKVYDPTTGKYYPAKADGTADTAQTPVEGKPASEVVIKAMPNTNEMALGNIKSTIGLNGKDADGNDLGPIKAADAKNAVAGADGKSGLLAKKGAELNNAATVGDLQAIAQAGLDFTGNNNTETTLHRTLGSKLVVEGETDKTDVTKATFGATAKDNIHVEAKVDGDTNKLVVSLAEDLKGINSLTTKPVKNADGTETTTKLTPEGTKVAKVQPAVVDPATGAVTTPAKELETANYGLNTELKKTDADGKVTTSTSAPTGTTLSETDKDGNKLREAEYDLDGTKVTSKDPATGVTKETTTGVDGTNVVLKDEKNPNNDKSAKYGVDGTELKAKDAAGNPVSADYKVGGATIADKDNTTEIKPDGMTVKSTDEADKSEAKYGKDGLSIVGPKGEDGKDGISLGYKPNTNADGTPVTGADGKPTSTPTLEFGKGEDGKGTGSITGLKDLERNADGTAKDKTAAATAGYVDERLAEVDAGKPFEYFEKDPATGDVKKDADGKPVQLVRGKDGKFYKDGELDGTTFDEATGTYKNADGTPLAATSVDSNNVTVQAMPSPTGAPIEMGNVGSGLGLDDSEKGNEKPLTAEQAKEAMNGKDGKSGLLEKTGASLNNAATVKDLQALAQAGLDFSGNVGETHRPLGSKLAIEGKSGVTDEQYTADYSTDNIATKVTADGKLEIAMKKEPEFNKLTVKTDSAPAVSFNTEKLTKDNTAYDINGNKIAGKEEVLTALNVGDKDGNPVKITGVADGDITPDSTQAVNGRQVYALTNGNQVVQNNDGSTVTYAKDKDGSVITEVKRDKNGNPVLDADGKEIVQPKEYKLTTYNVEGQTEFVTNSVITAVHNMNEQGIKFFHTNDDKVSPIDQTGPNGIDSSASGAYATAVGYQATASGTNALAMGKGATATGENSIAIGTGNRVEASKSGAFGDPNIIMGTTSENDAVSGSYAIGNDNVINSSNTFVLGNDVNNKLDADGKITGQAAGNTVENSVYLGNKSTATAGDGSATGTLKNLKQDGTAGSTTTAGSTGTVSSAKVGNMTYGGFAGAKADGVVSVGAAGNERRVQNVAAGEISATSTDAINGSQLYSVAKGVDQLDGKVNRMNRKLRSGIAAATAMTNIPQVTLPGKSALGAGVGSYDGQGALAVGYSRMSDNGRVILKLSAGASTQGKYNAGAGVAVQW
ncbi:MAG: YadA-like family protein [Actinobacillus porcinus]|nr:YadA-like family protein [Actinobacillus porcinus]MDY6215578.1 YadA-like family protein [Actinobacillus porcinus]